MSVLIPLGIVLLTVALTECMAWLVHKYLLHGPLWFLHVTHHRPQPTWWEWNDLVIVPYALASGALCVWGSLNGHWSFWVGIGIAVYGVLYFFLHDILVHQRIRFRVPVNGYLWRLVRAHKRHHKHMNRDHSEAFGFLYASPKYAKTKNERAQPVIGPHA